ncbi:hypothetical protein C1645_741533 [Glomus cerebriforme]|uniref:Phytocyanin domain-containing protein n=1 Tax=Glomus cerebriforme TaxID=658196 RepID=A0A397SHI4_9GLOM|nr:hypothetical protein C1645_741533 [Glomus cerebriforme]
MEKKILVLLTMLAFFTLQVFAKTCKSSATVTDKPTATISVFNNFYSPECLTVTRNQGIVWEWQVDNTHTVTSNDGPFGSCNNVPNPEVNFVGSGVGNVFPTDGPITPKGDNLFYKCNVGSHCRNGMSGQITVIDG